MDPLHFLARIVCAVLAVLTVPSLVQAETYPSRSISLVVGFAAGGPSDTIARILAERMRQNLGQPIIVENVTGASGSIAVGRVTHAAPDGYTVNLGFLGTHVINAAVYKLSYDPLNDLEPVSLVATNPILIVSRKNLPANNLRELVDWLKAHPGQATQGAGGLGTPAHVAGELFQQMTGTKIQFVPYRGAAPAMQDLVAGQIDLMFDQFANALAQVRTGTIKVYAATTKERSPLAPDVPTVDEAGLPGLYVDIWHALWVPKGTPRAIIDRLNSAVVDALSDPRVRQRFSEIGQEIPARDRQTPESLAAYQRAEIEKWWPIVRAANIKGE
jgi:tripartite-type tricarboxylate transporter receptor subunit TctC